MKATVQENETIEQVVSEGLSKPLKSLPSWLFYDAQGDILFQQIMRMPEYYLTRAEFEILQMNKEALGKILSPSGEHFNLVELGAGDGTKVEILLSHFSSAGIPYTYTPVDVSQHVLDQLESKVLPALKGRSFRPIHAKYEDALQEISHDDQKKVILFLGANIGNFTVKNAQAFVKLIASNMQRGDQLLIGFDLKKDPRLIQLAYDDAQGITRDFNLNLLLRLNTELGANFQIDQFSHYPHYDPETGTMKSYLVSLRDQHVYFPGLDRTFHFKLWELIHTEVSQKYDTQMIEALCSSGSLVIKKYFYDCKHYFCDVLFERVD